MQLANTVYPNFQNGQLKWLESEVLPATTVAAFANSYATGTPYFNTLFGVGGTFRTPYLATVAASGIKVGYVGYYCVGVGNGTTNLPDYPITVSFQRADPLTLLPTGTPTMFTWDGNGTTTKTITGGSNLTFSDELDVDIAEGETFYILNYVSTGSTGVPVNMQITNQSGCNYNASNVVATGSMTNNQANAGITAVAPSIIVGTIASSDKKAVMCFGDSITQGSGDSTSNSGRGWVGRAMYSTNPVINVGVGGLRASTFATDASLRTRLTAFAPYARDAMFALGFNDIYSAGATSQTVEGNITTCVGQLRALGYFRKIIGVTCKPSATSTDGWLTTTNQTPVATAEPETLSIVNNWILSQSQGGLFDAGFDFGKVFQLPNAGSTVDPKIINPGPANAIFTDTAGASTSTTAIRTSASTVGDLGLNGRKVALTHSATVYYGNIYSFRPGSPNILLLQTALGGAASGDSYTVYDLWNSDQAHPTGSGYTAAALAFPLGLVS